MFATGWSGSICKFHHCTHYGIDNIWNLHGLWPSDGNKMAPQNCVQSYFGESDYDQYVKENIYKFWNSYYNPNWGFIHHEIQKHGTCWNPESGDKSVMNPKLASVIEKFNESDEFSHINTFLELTIELSKFLDVYGLLAKDEIVPGDDKEYDIDDILNALKPKFKEYSVIPLCLKDRPTNAYFLAELRFCLDLNFEATECDRTKVERSIQICKKTKVKYPSYPKQVQVNTDSY